MIFEVIFICLGLAH